MNAPKPVQSEMQRGWLILTGSMLGIGTGVSALLLYTGGLFVADLNHAYGLTRTQFGFGVLMVTVALAVANPIAGWAVDRFGARLVAASGHVGLALGFTALATGVHSIASYLIIQALVALVAAGSGPISYAKSVSSWFDRSRGIALGLALLGIGLSAAIVPPLVARTIAAGSWQDGYWVLAAIAIAGILPSLLMLREAPRLAVRVGPQGESEVPVSDPLRSGVFWMMIVAFGGMALSFAGLLPHFVPMLIDGGFSPGRAGVTAGLIGMAVIGSRLVIGLLMDRLFAPFVAIGVALIAIAGCAALLAYGVAAAPFAALAIGCAMGGEVDLLSFLVARYFGTIAFGRVYGWQYSAFILASGMAPLWVGAVRDRTGNYSAALILCIGGLIVSMLLFSRLPRYKGSPT